MKGLFVARRRLEMHFCFVSGAREWLRLSTVSAILGIVGWIIRVMGEAIVGTCRERNRDC